MAATDSFGQVSLYCRETSTCPKTVRPIASLSSFSRCGWHFLKERPVPALNPAVLPRHSIRAIPQVSGVVCAVCRVALKDRQPKRLQPAKLSLQEFERAKRPIQRVLASTTTIKNILLSLQQQFKWVDRLFESATYLRNLSNKCSIVFSAVEFLKADGCTWLWSFQKVS